MAYDLIQNGTAIRCLECGIISYHQEDIAKHYCGRCNIFHDVFDASNPIRESPFEVGERIVLGGKEYEVLENNGKFGRVRGEGKVWFPFFWNQDGEFCRRM
jgi:ribosomal protein L37E